MTNSMTTILLNSLDVDSINSLDRLSGLGAITPKISKLELSDNMNRIALVNFQITLSSVEDELLRRNQNINPSHLMILLDDIRDSCLLQACAWMASGGVLDWLYRRDQCIDLIVNELQLLFRAKINSSKFIQPIWDIDLDTWIYCNAITAFGITDIILSGQPEVVEFAKRFGCGNLHFVPRRITRSSNNEAFNFTIEIVNRELLR